MIVLTYDIGTTGVKTGIFEVTNEGVEPIASKKAEYGIHVRDDGGVEQEPDEWWAAMAATTKEILEGKPELRDQIAGITFCAQQQSCVLVDKDAKPVYPSMSYMDQRGGAQMAKIVGQAPRIAGFNVPKLLVSLKNTGAAAASVKDPVWKYHWVRENRPAAFARAYKWLDVKEALIARMTHEFVMSEDSAFATLLYDINSDEMKFSEPVMKLLKVNPDHMPQIVACTDVVGPLLPEPAEDLGLPAGIPVIAGGGDASLIGLGSGSVGLNETHIYIGTSGWVGTMIDKPTVDLTAMIAGVVSPIHGRYNYFAELETAGKCIEWCKDHLAEDEINMYLNHQHVSSDDVESRYRSLYDYLADVMEKAEPGSGGVLFTPWLHGNRCPFEDPNARAMFFNISLNTGKTELLRAVVEGVCYHLRWFVETQEKKVRTSKRVRFVGGGALSPVTAQILADILDKTVEVVENPQDTGAVGAALLVATGLGAISDLTAAGRMVKVKETFTPRPENREVYDHMYAAFKELYPANKKIFAKLNGMSWQK